MIKVLKLGTRRSWLAWAQSAWVAKRIEEGARRKGRSVSVELVGIETRGDQIQDVPLQQVEGKDFFVAELDRALTDGSVDLVVHSLKDLSLERPKAISLAAVPKREDPRDTVFFSRKALESARSRSLVLGTSSPRRMETVVPFLKTVLPRKFMLKSVRGNVNTRIGKVLSGEYDAVVLAQAGVNRLLADPERGREMRLMLGSLLFVQLPLTECPTNPGQGALAVECRSRDAELLALLGDVLHDPQTQSVIEQERGLLKKFGGGCHQRFGASASLHPELGALLAMAGVWGNRKNYRRELTWSKPEGKRLRPCVDGSTFKPKKKSIKAGLDRQGILQNRVVLITHTSVFEALSKDDQKWLVEKSNSGAIQLMVPGTSTWKALRKLGLWICGSCEGLGQDWAERELGLRFFVLTHRGALVGRMGQELVQSDWPKLSRTEKERFSKARCVYWTSPAQFDSYRKWVQAGVVHACGAGRTARALQEQGVQALVFPSREEWKQWLKSV